MSEGATRIVVGEDGTIRVDRGAKERLRERSGSYTLTADAPGLLILQRDDKDRGGRVIMAGEILGRMTMLEVINVITNAGWRGELHVLAADGMRRVLTIDLAALKYARSNDPDDRLGEVLFRLGVLSRTQLDTLLREVTPDRRFGQLVVEKKYLDQEQLFHYLQKQAEQIFYGALLAQDGTYAFTTPLDSEPPPAHTVHIPVQGLLMEGVQRVDEMALFRERIPSSEMCPEVTPNAARRSLDPTATTILLHCDGTRTIDDIARETGLGEFHTTKAIYHLLSQGAVALRAPTRIDEAAVKAVVSKFNEVMRDIFMAVATYGGVDDTRTTVAAWIAASGYGPYFGETVDEDGSIDVQRIIRALEASPVDRPIEGLHQALHELAAFALFAATTTLPRDQELMLARDVNRRLKAIPT